MSDTKPEYLMRAVKNVEGKDKWTDIGVAFINARGSVTMILKAAGIDVTELDGGSSLSIKQAKTFKRYLGRI